MMRSILSKDEENRKKKTLVTVLGIFLALIMIFSVLSYAFYGSEKKSSEKKEYNGVEFVLLDNGFWGFYTGEQAYYTTYTPLETKNISVPFFYAQEYYGNPLYFSGESRGQREIEINLFRFVERMQRACIDECEDDFPVKNCSKDNVIIFQDSELTEIKKQEKCLLIRGSEEEQIRASDAFVFKFLGID